jgi:hypothetical protein
MNSPRTRFGQGTASEFGKSLLKIPDMLFPNMPGDRDMDRVGHDRDQD